MNLISTHVCKTQNVGFHGNLFGGVMLSWLDEAGAAFAAEVSGTPRVVTVKITEVIFRKPVRPGQIIKIYGRVVNFGNSSVTIKLEARRHSPYNGSQKIVCTTDMTFVRIDGDGEPVPINELVKKQFEENNES
jgi:acyl-CoA thioesterase YciA|tara:strand:- start:216 stop:614 length:399 start_codon:yes stop_codon:yes gene_type:complete